MRHILRNLLALIIPVLFFILLLNTHTLAAADDQWEILRKELQLNFSQITDDTTPTMTFITNPNTELKITLDEQKEFNQPASPLILPKLSFGIHQLKFEYKTNKNIKRSVTVTFSVVPPAPIINKQKTLFVKPNPLFLKGTAMAGSKVMLIINSQEVRFVTPAGNGEWYLPLEKTQLGRYNILAYTYYHGIISKEPDKVTLEYRLPKSQPKQPQERQPALSDQLKIYKDTLYNLINQNKQIAVALIILLATILLTLFLIYLKIRTKRKLEEKPLSELLKTKPEVLDDTHDTNPDTTKVNKQNVSKRNLPPKKKTRSKKQLKTKTTKRPISKSKRSSKAKANSKTPGQKSPKDQNPAKSSATIDVIKGGKISID